MAQIPSINTINLVLYYAGSGVNSVQCLSGLRMESLPFFHVIIIIFI